MRSRIVAGSSGRPSKTASTTMRLSRATNERRYPKSPGPGTRRTRSPAGVTATTSFTRSPIQRPPAPAFIRTQPPTLPGIPSANSSPESPQDAISRARRGTRTPAPARTRSPSRVITAASRALEITGVATPSSATITLLPAPRTRYRAPDEASSRTIAAREAASFGSSRNGAGPPTPIVVCGPRGSFTRHSTPSSAAACWRVRSLTLALMPPCSSAAPPLPRGRSARGAPGPEARRRRGADPSSRAPPGRRLRAGAPARLFPGRRGDSGGLRGEAQVCGADLPDASRAERQDEIAGARDPLEDGGDLLHVRLTVDASVTAARDPLGERPAVDTGDRRLARGVDVRHDDGVRVPEGAVELGREGVRARVAVRLEDDDEAPSQPLARGPEGRLDLRRVMAVVVDHEDAAALAADLEASVDACEPGERPRDPRERDVELAAHRDRRQAVEHVVAPRNAQLDAAERLAGAPRRVAPCETVQLHLRRAELRVAAEPVRDVPPLEAWQDRAHARIVRAQERCAVERHAVEERDEGVLDLFEVLVVVEVLAVDVRDDGQRRLEAQERAVGLVRLGHHQVALAEPRVRVERSDAAPHDDRGIEAAPLEDRGDHGRRRRLAVRARDRDAELQAHQLGEHLRARDDRHLQAARLEDLDVVGGDGGRGHDDVRSRDASGLVTEVDARAETAQALHRVVLGEIGAGHLVAEVEEHLGDPAHAAAADPHE